ncbi:hypothetical protein L1049_013712 [Liquidambar formosana]|uniref:RING-type domain-containing protein n=1 Tax=Liquidambar formosana TaxID=63359 RepID=A0AAP0WUJ1_LIQFO
MSSQNSKPLSCNFSQFNHNFIKFQNRGILLLLIFFSLVILIILFFLFARWIHHRRHLPTNAAAVFSSEPHATVVARPLGLDAATIRSLPISLHRSLDSCSSNNTLVEEEIECSICLTLFQGEEKVKVLPKCHHTYHPECVDKWLSTQSSCPLCRASLRVDPTSESVIP